MIKLTSHRPIDPVELKVLPLTARWSPADQPDDGAGPSQSVRWSWHFERETRISYCEDHGSRAACFTVTGPASPQVVAQIRAWFPWTMLDTTGAASAERPDGSMASSSWLAGAALGYEAVRELLRRALELIPTGVPGQIRDRATSSFDELPNHLALDLLQRLGIAMVEHHRIAIPRDYWLALIDAAGLMHFPAMVPYLELRATGRPACDQYELVAGLVFAHLNASSWPEVAAPALAELEALVSFIVTSHPSYRASFAAATHPSEIAARLRDDRVLQGDQADAWWNRLSALMDQHTERLIFALYEMRATAALADAGAAVIDRNHFVIVAAGLFGSEAVLWWRAQNPEA